MPETHRGNVQMLPIKAIEPDHEARPNLLLYRSEPSDIREAGYWQLPNLDTWPVDRPTSDDPRLGVLSNPESAQAKSYRVLRHRLLGMDNPRVIAVTSPKPGEGATTCAFNLAAALAEEVTNRVLFVECNHKRPMLAQLFDFVPPRCFMTQLQAVTSGATNWTVVEVAETKLHLLATHPHHHYPGVDRVLFASAIRQLRRIYDYIVIDTPSVLESADVNAVCDAVDGVVLSVRAKKSSRRALAHAIEQINPAPVLGVALLGSKNEIRI